MPRLFASKFQVLSVVVLIVAAFGVLAAFATPAAAQIPCPWRTSLSRPIQLLPVGLGLP